MENFNKSGENMKGKPVVEIPSVLQMEKELKRTKYNKQYWRVFRSTLYILVIVAAFAVLVATLWMPVLQIYGDSMTPELEEKDIVLSLKSQEYKKGDIIAFYYNNKILVKRVIANSGEWVDIDRDGTVYVDGKVLEEPYISDKALGDCNIKLPYQVPESRIFVMGDHRSVSIDSRNTSIGCVSEEQIVGKIVLKIWPLKSIEYLDYQ